MPTIMVGKRGNKESSIGDQRREVEFEGEKLTSVSNGDTRGMTKTLYDTPKGYIVHIKDWSNWVGEITRLHIEGPFDQKELSEKFPKLAREADLEVPASLEDVL